MRHRWGCEAIPFGRALPNPGREWGDSFGLGSQTTSAYRRLRAALLIVGGIAGLTGCTDRFPDYSYKMTIYADGKAFSSVRHVEVEEVSSMTASHGTRLKTRVDGEAVIIDLYGKTYYALLARTNPQEAYFVVATALAPYARKPAAKSDAAQAVDEYFEGGFSQDGFEPRPRNCRRWSA